MEDIKKLRKQIEEIKGVLACVKCNVMTTQRGLKQLKNMNKKIRMSQCKYM